METSQKQFKILEEKIPYKRFLTIVQRKIVSECSEMLFDIHLHSVEKQQQEFPDGRLIDWDICGHPHIRNPAFTVVFPFFSKNKTTSLISEYCQGPNEMKYGFASGGFDEKKHASIRETAVSELSEEANLKNGTLIPLYPEDSVGIAELKWGRNRFIPYLVIDPEIDETPGKQDDEEMIEMKTDITMKELKRLILSGEVMLPSVQTSIMAIEWLRKNGYLTAEDTLI
ncbi:hypothetical protein HK098_003764 [Nowakowskiella sp. JEL0407]|nr:hypothetical protein HK098_003764 [Nowakowskiella sp. JEL0407]